MIAPSADSPQNLFERARLGDQDAWEILFKECYPKIVRVIGKRLDRQTRKLYDSTDIANEVMKSLAAKFENFDFSSINGLQAFLIRAAEQKLIDEYRRGHARKRDVTRDRPIHGGNGAAGWEIADGSPTPSQVAVASEREENLLEAQSGPGRTIVELKIQGLSNSEVARETGWHVRKVERFLANLRATLRI